MPLFESKEDAELRHKIAAEIKADFDKEQQKRKIAKMRQEERAKLESNGILSSLIKKGLKEAKKNL